jgi:integrase
MARIAKPWFYRQSGWWMAYVNGQKTKLAYGRKNRQAARDKLLQLLLVASANVSPEEPDQTVASVIDQYLTHAADLLAESTREVRSPYLQSFTGCRPCEAAQLCWADVREGCIVLARHKTARTQKRPKPRIIPLHPVVVRLLITIRRRDEGERVFVNHRRTPWNKSNLALRVQRARLKAGNRRKLGLPRNQRL